MKIKKLDLISLIYVKKKLSNIIEFSPINGKNIEGFNIFLNIFFNNSSLSNNKNQIILNQFYIIIKMLFEIQNL